MARIVALDEVDPKIRQHLGNVLRVQDEAVVLPQSHRSSESGSVKNVVMRLSGSEPGLTEETFSANWFAGVSIVPIPNEKAEALLSDNLKRNALLKALAAAIPSEMNDSQLQVGPGLDGDDQDRDTESWHAGLDGPGCCVGLYSAMQSRAPEAFQAGMSRVHTSYYLVCKAGSGVTGQTFHARLVAALKQGNTLDECLSEEGSPGLRALRRVSLAAKRNRCRILTMAAEALGLYGSVDTIGDNASPSCSPYRIAVPAVDVCYNSLTNVDVSGGRTVWQYSSGCVDTALSQGLITSSNVAEGFVMFTGANGDHRVSVRNDAYCCIPFGTERLMNNRDTVFKAVDAHKAAKRSGGKAHPDHDWVSKRFSWSAKAFPGNVDIEPPCVWGSHGNESWISEWARELGVSRTAPVRLQPEIVALSAIEPGKLRVAVKAVASS
jgi:hypothetical protein